MSQKRTDLEVTIIPAACLAADDVADWNNIRADQPALQNPLFGPGFAQAVGRVRHDAHVAIYRRDGVAIGYLAHHRRPGGLGRPVGAPFCDYHALVVRAGHDLDGRTALEAAGLKAFRHNGLIDPGASFPDVPAGETGYAIELEGSPEAYVEALRAASPKRFKNWRRLRHRLEEQLGALELRASSVQADYDQLMDWKRAQFVRTGVQDVLRPAWSHDLMQSLFDLRPETDARAFRGLMLTLHAGDTLVGGHFGVAEAGIYHPWIASTNPELGYGSPGQALLHHAILAMPHLGLTTYDLGVGTDHYKKPFCNTERPIGAGLSRTQGLTAFDERRTPIAKICRRLDHIAASNPSFGGRVQGGIEAAIALRKRSLLTESPDVE